MVAPGKANAAVMVAAFAAVLGASLCLDFKSQHDGKHEPNDLRSLSFGRNFNYSMEKAGLPSACEPHF